MFINVCVRVRVCSDARVRACVRYLAARGDVVPGLRVTAARPGLLIVAALSQRPCSQTAVVLFPVTKLTVGSS